MKTIGTLILCLTLYYNLFGDEWELFPIHQKNYYSINSRNQDSYNMTFMCDSLFNMRDTLHYLFNLMPEIPCSNFEDDRGILDYMDDESSLNIDSLWMIKDTTYCFSFFEGQVIKIPFYHAAQPGESWGINSDKIIITCDSIIVSAVFDQPDSIKYFSINKRYDNEYLSERYFALSKNFGLIAFVPFVELFYDNSLYADQTLLIGLKKNEIRLGKKIPDFHDIFHLSKGDVIVWHYLSEGYELWDPDVSYYYKDFIEEATITNDTVSYLISRKGDYIKSTSYTFIRKAYDKLLNGNTNQAIFTNELPFSGIGWNERGLDCWQPYEINLTDSISSFSFGWGGISLDTIDCELNIIYDIGTFFSFDTRTGLNNISSGSWGFTERKVVGGIINGVKWGENNVKLNLKMDANELVNSKFKMFPNPCLEKINIEVPYPSDWYYSIHDLTNREIQSGQLNENNIEIETLNCGMYLISVSDKETKIVKKFIKKE